MNQQGSAKPERQECLQAPLEGGFQTHTSIYQSTCFFKWVPNSIKQPGILLPWGQIPKHRSHGFTPWLGKIVLYHCLSWPTPCVCNLCFVYVFHVYSHTEENVKQHSFRMWRNIKLFKANLKYWPLPLWMHHCFQQARFPATNHLCKSHFPGTQSYISASYCPNSSCSIHNKPSYPIFNYFPGRFPFAVYTKYKVFGFFQT